MEKLTCPGYWHPYLVLGIKFWYIPNYCRKFSLCKNYDLVVFDPICLDQTNALLLKPILLLHPLLTLSFSSREPKSLSHLPGLLLLPRPPLLVPSPWFTPLSHSGPLPVLRCNEAPAPVYLGALSLATPSH